MKQFVLPEHYSGEKTLYLKDGTFHHLVHVLRAHRNEHLRGIDRHSNTFMFEIRDIEKNGCLLEKIERVSSRSGEYPITLFQCLLKGKKLTQVIRQATESGVERIIPVLSEFCVPRLADPEGKLERLKKVALEAVEQSGAPVIPEIAEPIRIEDVAAARNGNDVALYCHNDPEESVPLHRHLSAPPAGVAVLIGPEGGLSKNDRQTLDAAGFLPIYLGGNTLRAETAAVYAIAAIQIILMERESWILKNH